MGQLGIIRDLLFYLVPKTCLEERAGRDHATPVSLSAPHTLRAPHKFSTQPSPLPNPQPSYNPDFLPVHSPLNSKPSSPSCSNPHPQGAHPPESIRKVGVTKVLPLGGLAVDSGTKPAFGGGWVGGNSIHTLGGSWWETAATFPTLQ